MAWAVFALLIAAAIPCGDPVSFQILLDRQGFGPGEIDGQLQTNGTRAIAAYQAAHDLPTSGQPDCQTWQALTMADSNPIFTTYRISPADVAGPFTRFIPNDLERQASLPALDYRSALERLAERFHAAPALLTMLNRGKPFVAGATIKVPAVEPFELPARTKWESARAGPSDLRVEVSKDDSAVRLIDGTGKTIFYAPVTSGSEHDPLPLGEWRVTSIEWLPVFHYNPDLFWDADPKDSRATLKPGPNNPVGVVWIGINAEHYGLHGTPEPSQIGHAQSHGCVRLTNWDAARLASMVAVGTPVIFK